MDVRPSGEIEIGVPFYLDWKFLKQKCCRDELYHEYDQALKRAQESFDIETDIFRFIRRSRMHGFGLHFTLPKSERNASSILAFSQPLREVEDTFQFKQTHAKKDEDKWCHVENLRKKD